MNRRFVILSVAARLPHGMFSIAVLVHVVHVTGSFAIAGTSTAALASSQAAGGPLAGRLVDRYGQTAVLAISTAGCSLGLGALAMTGTGASTGWFLGWSALVGLCAPPVGPCLRALVPDLVPTPSAVHRAYAVDAAATELTWVAGPVVTLLVASRAGTGAALLVTAAVLASSVAGFASCAASRRWRPAPMTADREGTLRSKNLQLLVTTLVGVGILFGATEVAVAAHTTSLDAPGAAGPLLGLWGLGSLCGGVVIARLAGGGAQTGPGLAALLMVLGTTHAALAAAGSSWLVFGLLITAAGSMVAPILGSAYGMVDRVAPTSARTEAFAWLATATAVGTAAGAAIAGVLVDAKGAGAGFLLAGAAAALAAALAGARLRLDPRTATRSPAEPTADPTQPLHPAESSSRD